jgi:hypothetical protein
MIEAVGNELGITCQELRDRISPLELKLAELAGAIDILRGLQPPPPAKFQTIRAWRPDTIYHEGAIVAFAGGTFQAQRDTARVPGAQDWVCLASAGHSFTVRGTFNETAEYHRLDVVALNGGSFVALKDAPGPCPGPGWQLLASQGKRGVAGREGRARRARSEGRSRIERRYDPRLEDRWRALRRDASVVGRARGPAARIARVVRTVFPRDEIVRTGVTDYDRERCRKAGRRDRRRSRRN